MNAAIYIDKKQPWRRFGIGHQKIEKSLFFYFNKLEQNNWLYFACFTTIVFPFFFLNRNNHTLQIGVSLFGHAFYIEDTMLHNSRTRNKRKVA